MSDLKHLATYIIHLSPFCATIYLTWSLMEDLHPKAFKWESLLTFFDSENILCRPYSQIYYYKAEL